MQWEIVIGRVCWVHTGRSWKIFYLQGNRKRLVRLVTKNLLHGANKTLQTFCRIKLIGLHSLVQDNTRSVQQSDWNRPFGRSLFVFWLLPWNKSLTRANNCWFYCNWPLATILKTPLPTIPIWKHSFKHAPLLSAN